MDLSDERLHRRRVPWIKLIAEGYDPRVVLIEAQKQRMWKLALSAKTRILNEKRGPAND